MLTQQKSLKEEEGGRPRQVPWEPLGPRRPPPRWCRCPQVGCPDPLPPSDHFHHHHHQQDLRHLGEYFHLHLLPIIGGLHQLGLLHHDNSVSSRRDWGSSVDPDHLREEIWESAAAMVFVFEDEKCTEPWTKSIKLGIKWTSPAARWAIIGEAPALASPRTWFNFLLTDFVHIWWSRNKIQFKDRIAGCYKIQQCTKPNPHLWAI